MADLIDRRKTIEHIKKRLVETALNNIGFNEDVYLDIADHRIETWVNEVPSAQPEIVRCKECKYADFDDLYGNYWCNRTMCVSKVNADDFCSKGGKRCLK